MQGRCGAVPHVCMLAHTAPHAHHVQSTHPPLLPTSARPPAPVSMRDERAWVEVSRVGVVPGAGWQGAAHQCISTVQQHEAKGDADHHRGVVRGSCRHMC